MSVFPALAKAGPRWPRWLWVVVVLVLAAFAIPFLGRPAERSPRSKSLSYMRGVFPALKMYAGDHDGRFPERLEDLEPEFFPAGALKRIRDLQRETDPTFDWQYFPGYTENSPANTLILASPSDGRYRIAVRADGSAEVLTAAEFEEISKRQPPREW